MGPRIMALFVIWSFVGVSSANFVCPTTHITKTFGTAGTVPTGANSPMRVPAGQNCTYTFDVPSGFALKIQITTDYEMSPGDGLMFDGYYVLPGTVDELEYAMDPHTTLNIVSITGNLTFLAKYEYIDLSKYRQVVKPTGAYFNASLEPNTYYTIKASTNTDQVNLRYGSLDTDIAGDSVNDVFIFDGNDIFNSKYVGRLSKVFRRHYEYDSSSSSLTLINLYNSPSDSVFLGNDASVTDPMDYYGLYVVDSSKPLVNQLTTEPKIMPDAYYTVICNGCASFTIDYLMFGDHLDFEPADPNGYISVQKMSPTRRLPTFVTYPYSTNNNGSFPKLITAPMATFHLHKATANFEVTALV